MHIIQTIILGIVEGVTEFLPISSTGHLILASSLLQIPQDAFQKTFEIVIQLGAILAVVVLYWRSFFDIEVLKKVIVGFIPTGIIGLALYKIVKTYLLGNESVVLWSLLLGGIALIVFENWHSEKESHAASIKDITYRQALAVGCFQAIAIIPGVSRSAATIVGGLLMGIKRTAIVEFSFLLAVPVMVAASGLDLLKNASTFSANDAGTLALGFIVSFIVALASIKWLLGYVRKHSFTAFGWYRVAIALVFFVFLVG